MGGKARMLPAIIVQGRAVNNGFWACLVFSQSVNHPQSVNEPAYGLNQRVHERDSRMRGRTVNRDRKNNVERSRESPESRGWRVSADRVGVTKMKQRDVRAREIWLRNERDEKYWSRYDSIYVYDIT